MSKADGCRGWICDLFVSMADSYVDDSWFMSMMVGENGYWLCPWQMVVEDGYVSMADSWR
jgi:hypothetical protein